MVESCRKTTLDFFLFPDEDSTENECKYMLFRKEDAIQKEYSFFDKDSTEFVQVHQRGGFSGGGRGWFLGIQGETYEEEGNFKKEGDGGGAKISRIFSCDAISSHLPRFPNFLSPPRPGNRKQIKFLAPKCATTAALT